MNQKPKQNPEHWDDKNNQWRNWKDEIQARAKDKITAADLSPVRIRNLAELRQLLTNFRPEIDTMANKLLKKGFKMIQQRVEYQIKAEAMDDVDFGGFKPAKLHNAVDQLTWVDNLVGSQMGGKREGTRICWDLPDGKFYYDPLTYLLTQADE